jgi:energy-coupling factor transport system permease protein
MSVFDGLKFRKVSSPIHNLDPRIKFFYVICIFVAAIMFKSIIPLVALFVMQLPFVFVAKVEKQWLRSMRGAAFLAAFIFIVNIVTRFFSAGWVFTAFDIEEAAAMTLRFVCLLIISVFFLTVT